MPSAPPSPRANESLNSAFRAGINGSHFLMPLMQRITESISWSLRTPQEIRIEAAPHAIPRRDPDATRCEVLPLRCFAELPRIHRLGKEREVCLDKRGKGRVLLQVRLFLGLQLGCQDGESQNSEGAGHGRECHGSSDATIMALSWISIDDGGAGGGDGDFSFCSARLEVEWRIPVCVSHTRTTMKTPFVTAVASLCLLTTACALDSPRDILKKLFGRDSESSNKHRHETSEHCGRMHPHAAHHWDDDRGRHRDCPGVPSKGLIKEQCRIDRTHAAHVWKDEHGHYCQCSGVQQLSTLSCNIREPHRAHVWQDRHGHTYQCMGSKMLATVTCESGRPHGPHVYQDSHGHTYQCPGVKPPTYAKANCPSHKRHGTHVWEDERGRRFVCSGHE